MQAVIAVVVGLMVSAPVVAEPLVEGWVRQSSGEPVEAAQVRVFDWTDLQRGAVAQATTDAAGYFALPLASLGGSVLPQAWTLGQNYPNPFNPSTLIPYQVPTAGRVRLEVFNVLGQRVATLVDGERSAGVHTAVWDATDAVGRAVGAGVYFYRLRSAGHPTLTRRMVLVDGQAGQVAASVALPQAQPTAPAAEGVYGLSVTGAGLVTYVDASFGVRSGMAAVEVVVDAVAGLPRGKALTGGVLGDVNGDGQVTLDDALLVMTYVANGSVDLPANGDISLGDVNGDGLVNLADALLVMTYVANPADASLPSGIGQAVSSSGGGWVAGARRLTDNSADDWSPSWSPDGRHLAFFSERDGNWEIYMMGSDGSDPRRLTNNWADGLPAWLLSWSPDGRHLAFFSERDGNWEIYVMDSDGSDPRRLTDNSAYDASPSWSPDGRHIAFVSDRDGDAEIYVMGSDGSNPRRLTDNLAAAWLLSWSPDGRHIAFMSDRDGDEEIYVIDSDGSNLRNLTNHRDNDGLPSWSPDGRHLAFFSERDGNWEIYVMDSDGSNLRNLTNHRDNDGLPSWSPDGRHIAFVSDRDGDEEIYVMDSDGSNPRRLTYNSVQVWDFSWSPSWSPDGRHIAFVSDRDGDEEIYVIDSDGSALRNLTDHSADDRSPSWSPDGRHIAFQSDRDGDEEIYVIDSDGSALRNLTDHSAADWFPSWSPDGHHIAFQSDRDGDREIYVMGSDGSNPRRLTDNSARDWFPSWSPDGHHIAFYSDRDGDREIYVMGSDGSNPRRLTDNSAWDVSPSWSPDGRHIAFYSDRDGNWEIYVIGSDGSNLRNLTDHSADDYSLTWSPDGRHIAFVSDRDGDEEIYVMGSDGSTPRRLTYNSADDWSPSWSPDGRHIAFESKPDRNWEIYVMKLSQGGSGGTPFDDGGDTGGGGTALDDGDSPATARPLAVGASTEGELSAGDSDYFRVTVSNAGTLVASTTGSTDTYGSIEDSSGNVLNENDDGGEGRNFLVSAAVEPGTYYIRVRGFNNATGSYTLHVSVPPDLVVESPSVSDRTLTTGQSFTLRATVRNRGGGQAGSTTLRYYLSTNSTISTSNREVGTDRVSSILANGVSDESISLNAPTSSGTYYYGACVESVSGESNTDNNCSTGVRVTVGTLISSSACETSLGVVSSMVSRSGTWTSDCRSEHSASNGFYARYYAFTLSRNSGVTIDLTSSEDSFLILLSGEGKNGTVIETDDDDGNGSNARIRRNLSAGTYTVEATTYQGGTTGNFTLRIDVDQGSTSSTTGGAFDIELVFLNDNDFTSSQKALLQQAAAHWMSIITGDIEDVDFSDNPFDEWSSTLNARIRVNDTVDDLRLFVRAIAIDGPYNTGGQGGHWMILRGEESHLLPKIGTIIIDTADLQRLEEEGALLGTFLHEIGHALGITEIMRQELDLLRGNNDRYFTGPLATQAFNNAGGRNYNGVKVPTERDGAHWRQSVFGDELMSPSSYSSDNSPLSTVTIQSLADIGYRVDVTQADAYRLPEPESAKLVSDHVPVGEDCILNGPIYVVEENGRIIRVIGE